MTLSFQDKIRPVATPSSAPTSDLSFADKIRPISVTEEPQSELGIVDRLKTNIKESGMARGEAVKDIKTAFRAGEQGPISSTAQIAGQLIGATVGDPLINIAKTVAPKTTEKIGEVFQGETGFSKMVKKLYEEKTGKKYEGIIKPVIEKISDAPIVQKFAESPASRVLERDIEAVNNWLLLLAPGKVPPAIRPATKVLGGLEKKAVSTVQNRSVNQLEKDYLEWTGATKSGMKRITKAENRTQALSRAGTEGVTPSRALAEEGIIPKTEGTKFSTADQANAFRESNQPLYDANRQAIREIEMQTEKIKLSDLEKRAIENARTTRNIAGGKFDDLANNIKSEFENYRKNYGESVSLGTIDDIKSARWADTKFDMTKPLKSDINYNIAKSAQKTIEETASKAGFDDVAQFNRYIGDRLEAAKFLESLHGQTIKGGRLGKYVGMTLGSIVGAPSGPLAALFGVIAGNSVANILIKASVANPIKRLILRSIRKTNPEVFQKMKKFLEEQVTAREGREALPPASFTPQGSARPPESSVRSVMAAKGEPGRVPAGKTGAGRFFGTFSSSPVENGKVYRYQTAKTGETGVISSKTAHKPRLAWRKW